MNSDQFIMHSRPSMKGEFIKTEHFEIKIIDGVLEVSFSERLDLTLPIAKNFVKEILAEPSDDPVSYSAFVQQMRPKLIFERFHELKQELEKKEIMDLQF